MAMIYAAYNMRIKKMSLPGFLFPDARPDGAFLTALAPNALAADKFFTELLKHFM